MLDQWDNAFQTWWTRASFGVATAACSARFGYATADVVAQLEHVVARCRADVLRELVRREVPSDAERPATVLVLASGGVPGLVLEGIASALALGARALVRASRDECVLGPLLDDLAERAPDVRDRIEVIDAERDGVPWDAADSAIVFGTDETIALVRGNLDPRAAHRVAGYGSRQGIAVVTHDATRADPSWARRIADDVLTFRQRGCMSPSWLFILGSDDVAMTRDVVGQLGRELTLARPRHLAPGADDHAAQRRASDADVLGAIAAGMSPDPRVLYAGDARLTVVPVVDPGDLFGHVAPLGSLLQTAVLAATDSERDDLTAILGRAGCTRTVAPGDAHRPDPLWPQDGIGRLAPLVG